jgi:hypothetical protein
MKISENTSVSLPIRNLLAIVGAVAIGVWAYFGIIERITLLETADKLQKTQEQNMTNKVNIERIQKDIDKILIDVEKLKDSVRANLGKLNGNH